MNRLFVLSFENNAVKTGHRIRSSKNRNKRLQCYDWFKKCFDQRIRTSIETYKNVRKIATGQGYDHATVCHH